MNRRHAIGGLAILALVPARNAAAQTTSQSAQSSLEMKHVMETLDAGGVSLEASRVAISKATDPKVKRFAQFEAAEQETMATVLKSRANLSDNQKPAIDPKGKAMIDTSHAAKTGPDFDSAYIDGQIEGHQRLLQIQEAYLSNGKDNVQQGIAMLARGHIREHLATLETIRKDMKG